MDNTKELTHISLCAGYGGIDLGLKRAIGSVRTIAFSEIETFVTTNLVAKMEAGLIEPAPIWTNLKTFPWDQFRGKVDILSGGFPCQPFSQAGKGRGDEDPRHLWPHIVRGIEVCRPSLLFFENVSGIIGAKLGQDWGADIKGTPVLLHILRELERRDYTPSWGVFSASEVGAPHQRKRVFIFAQADELKQDGIDYITELLDRPKDYNGEFGSLPGVWPEKRGLEQESWEPPRTIFMGNSSGDDDKPPKSSDQQKGEEGNEEWLGSKSKPIRPSESSKYMGNTKDLDALNGGWESRNGQELAEPTRESNVGSCTEDTHIREEGIEPKMGRDSDGIAYWMGISELYESFTDRQDELRLLGNGVVPKTAERAFKILWKQVNRWKQVNK